MATRKPDGRESCYRFDVRGRSNRVNEKCPKKKSNWTQSRKGRERRTSSDQTRWQRTQTGRIKWRWWGGGKVRVPLAQRGILLLLLLIPHSLLLLKPSIFPLFLPLLRETSEGRKVVPLLPTETRMTRGSRQRHFNYGSTRFDSLPSNILTPHQHSR